MGKELIFNPTGAEFRPESYLLLICIGILYLQVLVMPGWKPSALRYDSFHRLGTFCLVNHSFAKAV